MSVAARRVAARQKQAQDRNLQRLLTMEVSRPDYDAWARAVSAFANLPVLRAFWPMSALKYANPQVTDIANGYDLTNNNASNFTYDGLAPCVDFTSGSSQYLDRADGGAGNWADIIGTETYVQAAVRGLTVGAWFAFDGLAANESLIGKLAGGGQQSYLIQKLATDAIRFSISSNGVALFTATTTETVSVNTWYFIVGRFWPSTRVQIDVMSVAKWEAENTTAIPATIFDSTAAFQISGFAGATQLLDGKASLCFLCACVLSDGLVAATFQQSRALFGV